VGYDEPNLNDLASTAGAQTLLYKTYAAGGQMEMIQQQDRTALRLTFPKWAVPMVADQDLAKFFIDVPKATRPTTAAADGDFRSHVEDEIRSALLPAQNEPQEYSSDDAFVAMSAPVSEALRDALSAIPRRGTSQKPVTQINRLPAERTLRFKADLPTGGLLQGVVYHPVA
jgi:hypothetical protein